MKDVEPLIVPEMHTQCNNWSTHCNLIATDDEKLAASDTRPQQQGEEASDFSR